MYIKIHHVYYITRAKHMQAQAQAINNLFTKYGYKQINKKNATELFFVKYTEKQLDEYKVELTSDNTFNVTIPLKNSDFLYTNTLSTIEDVKTYIEFHLQNEDN